MQEQIINIVTYTCKKAGIPTPNITFKTKGHVAGWFKPSDYSVDYNLDIAKSAGIDKYTETVIHEIAHAVDWKRNSIRYSSNGRRLLHDKVWKDIMSELGYHNAKATHNYETKPAKIYRKFLYECKCDNNIIVKTPTHNKIQKNNNVRICLKCKTHFGRNELIKEIKI